MGGMQLSTCDISENIIIANLTLGDFRDISSEGFARGFAFTIVAVIASIHFFKCPLHQTQL